MILEPQLMFIVRLSPVIGLFIEQNGNLLFFDTILSLLCEDVCV